MNIAKAVILIVILALVSASDMRSRKIPNNYILALMVLWIPVAFMDTSVPVLSSVLGFFAGGLLLYIAAVVTKGGIGGGDVKLVAASGLYLGLMGLGYGITYGFLLSAVYSLVMVAAKKITLKDYIPLGPFLSIGILLAYFMN